MPRRRGRPGLIGTMARTAVITSTATAVNRSMTQPRPGPEPAPVASVPAAVPPPATGAPDLTAKLVQLGELHGAGVLSDEEFAAAKAKLLG